MTTTLSTSIARLLLTAIKENMELMIVEVESGKNLRLALNEYLEARLSELPELKPKPVRKAASNTLTPVTNTAPAPKRTAKAKDPNVPKCQGIRSDNTACPSNSKGDPIDGKYFCGVHARSKANKQPDPNARPNSESKTTNSLTSFNAAVTTHSAYDQPFNDGESLGDDTTFD